jgi:hypothetical protein
MHSLRHTVSQELRAAGVMPDLVSDALGHSVSSMGGGVYGTPRHGGSSFRRPSPSWRIQGRSKRLSDSAGYASREIVLAVFVLVGPEFARDQRTILPPCP